MTQDEIVEMVKKAGWSGLYSSWTNPTTLISFRVPLNMQQLEAFTNLVAAKEREVLAKEQEPVAWLITDEKINSLQVDSIQRLVDRARHAHMTDIKLRINGQDEWHQADWLKHLTRTTPPQRTWVGLTNEEKSKLWEVSRAALPRYATYAILIEDKLKQKNGYAEENT
jgi:hypothetical protein